MTEQEAIIKLAKEIDILNKAPVHVNKLHDVEIAVEARKTAISALEEIQQYRELGALEELREAREKQVPKKPTVLKYFYFCPNCGTRRSIKQKHCFCHDCGQAIDWD